MIVASGARARCILQGIVAQVRKPDALYDGLLLRESCRVCHLAGRTAHWWTEQGNRQSLLVEQGNRQTYVPEEGFGECGTGTVRLTTS